MNISQSEFQPTCKVCERSVLVSRRVFRMSGPVVVIGFILLIPSVLGMLTAGLVLLQRPHFYSEIANGRRANFLTCCAKHGGFPDLAEQQL